MGSTSLTRIKPGSPALGVCSLGHWTMREVLLYQFPKERVLGIHIVLNVALVYL